MKSKETISMMSYSLNNNLSFQIDNSTSGNNQMSCWNYWTEYYYPEVIHYSYPVYIQERAKDKGKKAYEVVKVLRDKKVIKLEKVSDFIKLMDALIEIL